MMAQVYARRRQKIEEKQIGSMYQTLWSVGILTNLNPYKSSKETDIILPALCSHFSTTVCQQIWNSRWNEWTLKRM